MTAVLFFATILMPIITALVEMVKKTVNLPVNYLPVLSLFVGLLIGFLAEPFTELDTVMRLWAGGLAGLSGVGLFELMSQREGKSKEGNYNEKL